MQEVDAMATMMSSAMPKNRMMEFLVRKCFMDLYPFPYHAYIVAQKSWYVKLYQRGADGHHINFTNAEYRSKFWWRQKRITLVVGKIRRFVTKRYYLPYPKTVAIVIANNSDAHPFTRCSSFHTTPPLQTMTWFSLYIAEELQRKYYIHPHKRWLRHEILIEHAP